MKMRFSKKPPCDLEGRIQTVFILSLSIPWGNSHKVFYSLYKAKTLLKVLPTENSNQEGWYFVLTGLLFSRVHFLRKLLDSAFVWCANAFLWKEGFHPWGHFVVTSFRFPGWAAKSLRLACCKRRGNTETTQKNLQGRYVWQASLHLRKSQYDSANSKTMKPSTSNLWIL